MFLLPVKEYRGNVQDFAELQLDGKVPWGELGPKATSKVSSRATDIFLSLPANQDFHIYLEF